MTSDGGLQVEAHAARVGGEEDAAVGIIEKFLDEIAALGRGNIACEFDIAETDTLENGFGEGEHGRPLTEEIGFVSVGGDFFGEDFFQFGEFGRGLFDVFGLDLLVVKRESVADQAHFDQIHQEQFALFRRERAAL